MSQLIVASESPECPRMPGSSCLRNSGILSFFLNFLAVFEDSEKNDNEAERNGTEDENNANDAELSAESGRRERRAIELAWILLAKQRREQ